MNERVSNMRIGWILWCNFFNKEDCANPDQEWGFSLAARANDEGGTRPSIREAQDLTGEDLP